MCMIRSIHIRSIDNPACFHVRCMSTFLIYVQSIYFYPLPSELHKPLLAVVGVSFEVTHLIRQHRLESHQKSGRVKCTIDCCMFVSEPTGRLCNCWFVQPGLPARAISKISVVQYTLDVC
jgi:hypothetical protein